MSAGHPAPLDRVSHSNRPITEVGCGRLNQSIGTCTPLTRSRKASAAAHIRSGSVKSRPRMNGSIAPVFGGSSATKSKAPTTSPSWARATWVSRLTFQ
jgi:hypothetical protein